MSRLEEALFVALEEERNLSEERALLPGILQHDLANVLCQVSMCTTILATTRNDAVRSQSLRDLQGGVKRMNELFAGMRQLFLTRDGAKDFAHGDLAAFITALVREPGVWPAGAPIALDLPAVVPVLYSPLLMRHALVNLIGNAVAYSRGSWVRVRLVRAAGDNWHLLVANGGPGIPVDHQPYLFELTSEGKTAPKIGSTGIGLYIARRCVRSHGSILRVRSREGLTVFSFHVRGRHHPATASGGDIQPLVAV